MGECHPELALLHDLRRSTNAGSGGGGMNGETRGALPPFHDPRRLLLCAPLQPSAEGKERSGVLGVPLKVGENTDSFGRNGVEMGGLWYGGPQYAVEDPGGGK